MFNDKCLMMNIDKERRINHHYPELIECLVPDS